jgi:hypothetical protein
MLNGGFSLDGHRVGDPAANGIINIPDHARPLLTGKKIDEFRTADYTGRSYGNYGK